MEILILSKAVNFVCGGGNEYSKLLKTQEKKLLQKSKCLSLQKTFSKFPNLQDIAIKSGY